MDIRRRPPKPSRPAADTHGGTLSHHHHLHKESSSPVDNSSLSPTPKASDALPLPLYLTNTIFFTLFFSVAYYLLHRWRDKIRSSTPLHVVTFSEIACHCLPHRLLHLPARLLRHRLRPILHRACLSRRLGCR
ncbi:hypothetical protein L1049_026389 [Liquidambar formosana]|uniref:Uncharacterized protein n=1 Tax=Liquidambar formosana TaxID=63359 RepID=A0AAP0NGA9_LIQFO